MCHSRLKLMAFFYYFSKDIYSENCQEISNFNFEWQYKIYLLRWTWNIFLNWMNWRRTVEKKRPNLLVGSFALSFSLKQTVKLRNMVIRLRWDLEFVVEPRVARRGDGYSLFQAKLRAREFDFPSYDALARLIMIPEIGFIIFCKKNIWNRWYSFSPVLHDCVWQLHYSSPAESSISYPWHFLSKGSSITVIYVIILIFLRYRSWYKYLKRYD